MARLWTSFAVDIAVKSRNAIKLLTSDDEQTSDSLFQQDTLSLFFKMYWLMAFIHLIRLVAVFQIYFILKTS